MSLTRDSNMWTGLLVYGFCNYTHTNKFDRIDKGRAKKELKRALLGSGRMKDAVNAQVERDSGMGESKGSVSRTAKRRGAGIWPAVSEMDVRGGENVARRRV